MVGATSSGFSPLTPRVLGLETLCLYERVEQNLSFLVVCNMYGRRFWRGRDRRVLRKIGRIETATSSGFYLTTPRVLGLET